MKLLTLILAVTIHRSQPIWVNDFVGLLFDLEHQNQTTSGELDDLLVHLRGQINKFAPVNIEADLIDFLDEKDKKVLTTLVEAAKYMDDIFGKQVWSQFSETKNQLVEEASKDELAKAKLDYFKIMVGPWDRLRNSEPFAVNISKPLGAGFYPEHNFDAAKFRFYLAAHENERSALESPVTVVRAPRKIKTYPTKLKAVPYSQEYSSFLGSSAQKLLQAADISEDQELQTYLKSAALAIQTNGYFVANKNWLALNSGVQMAIGPYDTTEDQLMGLKRGFEAFVYIVDQDFNLKSDQKLRSGLKEDINLLQDLDQLLPELEANLPVDENMKNPAILQKGRSDVTQINFTKTSKPNKIQIADLYFSSGAARKPLQPCVFTLPDQRNGVKKVLLRNILLARHEKILTPVANKLMKVKQLKQGNLDSDATLHIKIFHMISQSLGPVYVRNDKNRGEIKQALGDVYLVLDYCKSSLMGIYNLMQKFKQDWIQEYKNKILFTYIASLLQNLHVEPEGSVKQVSSAILLNKFLQQGSIVRLPEGRYQVNYYKVEVYTEPLIKEFVTLLYDARKEDANKLITEYGVVKPDMKTLLDNIQDLPIDIYPQTYTQDF